MEKAGEWILFMSPFIAIVALVVYELVMAFKD